MKRQDTKDKIKLFYNDMVFAIKDCDNKVSIASVKKNPIEANVYTNARAQIENLLWKYNERFEGELNHEMELQ